MFFNIIENIIIFFIFSFFYLERFFFKKNDFKKNEKIFEDIRKFLKDSKIDIIRQIPVGSIACGISVKGSDIDFGIKCHNINNTVNILLEKSFNKTTYDHFINMSGKLNNNDIDIKIYLNDELEKLEDRINKYRKKITLKERCYQMALKYWYSITNQSDKYKKIKENYYYKNDILIKRNLSYI